MLGKVGGCCRVRVAGVDVEGLVPGQGLVRAELVVLDPECLGVCAQVQGVGDLFEEQLLVLQGAEGPSGRLGDFCAPACALPVNR